MEWEHLEDALEEYLLLHEWMRRCLLFGEFKGEGKLCTDA